MEFIDLKSQQALIRKEIDRRIAGVLDHGRYLGGSEISELENQLAERTGSENCIAVSSGTDALLISLMALGIGVGDEVITVTYTWISTAEVILLVGAKPVFVDITPDTWNIDVDCLEAAITENTKAIIPVGIYGQPADIVAINQIAAEHNLHVIEDAAQSFGATQHGKQSGALSKIGCTSFFPSKPLGCYGDGGAIFTDDHDLASRMNAIRVHGQTEPHYHPYLGITGRLDTIQAAVLLAKLNLFDAEIEKRNEVASCYNNHLRDAGLSITLPHVREGNRSVWAQYTILSQERDTLGASLRARDIPSVSYYKVPLHLQPVFSGLGYKVGDLPVTEKVASQGISLPMNPYLSEKEVESVCITLTETK